MDKKKIIKIFKELDLSNRYIILCNKFSNYDNLKTPTKNNVLKELKRNKLDLTYSISDKLFYEEFELRNIKLRFLLFYKYGMIGALYIIWNENESFIDHEICNISEEIDAEFFNKVKYRYPLSTSADDLSLIFKEITAIHKEFKTAFIKQYD